MLCSAEAVSIAADGILGAAEGMKKPAESDLSSAGVCARAAEPFPQGVGAFFALRVRPASRLGNWLAMRGSRRKA